jgi:hypothetical protein
MTYPTASKLRYCLMPVLFVGGALILAHQGRLQSLPGLAIIIVIGSLWVTFTILICPVCFDSVEKTKSGIYLPWIGPKCRHCEADLSLRQISFDWRRRHR